MKNATTKQSAAVLRTALRKAFPGTKFSVTMSRGTAYGNVRVSWTDGPTREEVQGITNAFEGATFDGMTDSQSYTKKPITVGGEEMASGIDLLLLNRSRNDD